MYPSYQSVRIDRINIKAITNDLEAIINNLYLYREQCSFTCIYGGSDGKESACNDGDASLIPRLERSPGELNGYPLQHSCLENSMDRGVGQAAVHGIAESDTTV